MPEGAPLTTIIITFLLFAAIHSITVSFWFKGICQAVLGETFMRVLYRFLYNMISVATVLVVFTIIRNVPDEVIWMPPNGLRWTMQGIQTAGLLFGVSAFRHMDTGEFMGWRQVWRFLKRKETAGNIEGLTERGLVTTGVYGIVRHPMYLAGIIIVTFSPVITVNGATFTVLADLYFLFGMLIEERRFLKIFGDQYRDYMIKVPRLMPKIRKSY
jgi:steroid 5-alpha reductase family enzyme